MGALIEAESVIGLLRHEKILPDLRPRSDRELLDGSCQLPRYILRWWVAVDISAAGRISALASKKNLLISWASVRRRRKWMCNKRRESAMYRLGD